MDYRDRQAGVSENFFRYQGKKDLLGILFREIHSKHPLRILNVGAGTGEDLSVINQFGEVHVVDINPNALELIPKSFAAETRVGDICDLPYPDHSFDLVVALDVLEHVADDARAVREVRRVLNPYGFFIVMVPAGQFMYGSHDRALDHFRRYDRASLLKLLSDFNCVDVGYWVFFLFAPVAVQRLLSRHAKPKIQYIALPRVVNWMLAMLMRLENRMIEAGIHFPFGINLYGIFSR
jgi:SAM-dependent methyltransferase